MLSERVGLSGWAGRSSSPVAVISRSLDEMVGICDEFELSEDGLDEFHFAVYRYVGKYFLLLRYFNYPGEGRFHA
ncbi:hypothetical protein VNPA120889_05450 [Pseudomonas aeruginosa]|nr:hypothetical protein VNPA120840_58440 [Pseudomonas aeruginosa]GLF00396.1 hypothetical protein VNPA120889_05450 [Pseudomonas aeruginosa]